MVDTQIQLDSRKSAWITFNGDSRWSSDGTTWKERPSCAGLMMRCRVSQSLPTELIITPSRPTGAQTDSLDQVKEAFSPARSAGEAFRLLLLCTGGKRFHASISGPARTK